MADPFDEYVQALGGGAAQGPLEIERQQAQAQAARAQRYRDEIAQRAAQQAAASAGRDLMDTYLPVARDPSKTQAAHSAPAPDAGSPASMFEASPLDAADKRKALAERVAADTEKQQQRVREALAARAGAPPASARASGLAGEYRDAAIVQGRLLDSDRRKVRVPNKLFGLTQRYLERQRDLTQGDDAAVPTAQREQMAEQVESAGRVALYQQELETRNLVEQAATEAQERARAERLSDQQQAVAAQQDLVHQAAQKLASQPDVDPRRYWKNKSAGNKFLLVLGAMAQGAVGRTETLRAIRAAIDDDIGAQREAIAKRGQEFSAAQAQVDEARGVFQDLRQEFGDQRLAEDAFRLVRLQNAEQQFRRVLADNKVQQLGADQQAFLADLQVEQNQIQQRLDKATVANVPFRTKIRHDMGPAERAARQGLLAQDIKTAAKLEQTGASLAGKEQEQRIEAQIKATAQSVGDAKELRKQAIEFGKETRNLNTGLTLVDDILKDYAESGDIPGFAGVNIPFGIGQGHSIGADARDTQKRLGLIRELVTKNITGAAATEAQQKLTQLLAGGQSEAEVARGLRDIRRMFEAEKQTLARGYDPRAIQIYSGTEAAPRPGVDIAGLSGRSNAPGGSSVVKPN